MLPREKKRRGGGGSKNFISLAGDDKFCQYLCTKVLADKHAPEVYPSVGKLKKRHLNSKPQYLLGAGGKLDPGPLGVWVVGNDGGVVAAGPGQLAPVPGLLLEVADDGALGHVADGHDVADGELGLLAAVNELAAVHALGGDQELLLDLVAVGIAKVGDGEGGATSGVVDDVLDHALERREIQAYERIPKMLQLAAVEISHPPPKKIRGYPIVLTQFL